MKVFSLFFVLVFCGFPLSLCAQLPGEVHTENEAGEPEQAPHLRSHRPSVSSTEFVSSHTVSSDSAKDAPPKQGALHTSPADVPQGPSGDEGDGKGDYTDRGDKESGLDWLAHLGPAIFESFFESGAKVDPFPTAAGGGADSKTPGPADTLDPTVSVDDDTLGNAEGRHVPTFLEQIEAAMQPLFAPSIFSALRSFEDALMPVSFSGPKVTSHVDDDQCIYDVDLQRLPKTASLRVGVEGRRVFIEYADSVKRVSDGKGDSQKGGQESSEEGMQNERSTHQPTASTGQSEDHAQVYSFESFQVPEVCDHESSGGKASRTGPDHLQITFPRKESSAGVDTSSRLSSSETPPGSQEPPASDSEATQDFAVPYTRRFMKQKSIYSTGEGVSPGGASRSKPIEPQNVQPKSSEGRRYISIIEEDAL